MQVYNNPQIPSTTIPNFKAIKTVKCAGLYKKYPQYAEKLVYTLRNNPVTMSFCKDRDVDIVFYACKNGIGSTESSLHIFYDNPVRSGIKKFLDFMQGKKETIKLTAWANEYNTQESLKKSTEELIERISPYAKDKGSSGLLDSHIKLAEEEIHEALAKKSKKQEEKLAKIAKLNYEKVEAKSSRKSLEDSIHKLIESSK